LAGFALLTLFPPEATAFWRWWGKRGAHAAPDGAPESAGTWYWLRSPEQERRVIASHYNRYCLRCHGADGRGVWDIPDVPDLTSPRWQASRSDDQLTRAILEGRGAVMPAFRGTLTLEEAWAMTRYLRTFVPGTEVSPPDVREPEKAVEQVPAPKVASPDKKP